ncbi:MAG: polysaccharide pyruvyl transferase family protein [Leptolyngbya sp. SIO4C1]|nr:polysaccharide pyruvyl transferase family protein [Leptolyngbya sp. SIO4C1]
MKLFLDERCNPRFYLDNTLNAWLWPKLLPNLFDQDESMLFVGSGTRLNSSLPALTQSAKRLIIFSTGAGYGRPLQSIPASWQIACVRGPMTAAVLAQPAAAAITDGSILVSRCFQPSGRRTVKYSFMPDAERAAQAQPVWQKICQQLDIGYIDPQLPVEQRLSAISETHILLTEALQGAMLADALRVPWIPLLAGSRVLQFKWKDWCAAMALPYRPIKLPSLPNYPRLPRLRLAHRWQRLHQTLSQTQELRIATQLEQIIQQAPTYLSQDVVFEQRLEQLDTALLRLLSQI